MTSTAKPRTVVESDAPAEHLATVTIEPRERDDEIA